MEKIFEYLELLLANPSLYNTDKVTATAKLEVLIDTYADTRPPSIDRVKELLRDDYPSLEDNISLIEKGDALRTEMMDKVFDKEFVLSDVKDYEGRINLFEKLMEFNGTITKLIENVSGTKLVRKVFSDGKPHLEFTDRQGTAQSILKNTGNGKKI